MDTSGRPLRFLFLTADKFPPYRPDVETLFGKMLLEHGYKIDWIMQGARADAESGQLQWRGCDAWIAPTDDGTGRVGRVRKHLMALRNDARVFSLLAKRAYDFVQVKDKFLAALMALIAARLKGVPFCYWLSFPYPEASLLAAKKPEAKYRVFYWVRGIVLRTILYGVICRFADHIFVQSDEMKRSFMARGVPESRLTAVPMGVDLRDFGDSPDSRSNELADTQVILYLGSLGRARKLEFVLEAFKTVAAVVPGATLHFVGEADDAEDRTFLETRAAELGLADRVVFTGFLPRAAAISYLRRASVCVSPIPPTPIYDVASPTKILEYMAAGKPVVANDQPDQRAVLEESGGGICTPYEPEAFARALIDILGNPEMAREMGRRGRSYLSAARTYEAISQRVEHQYRKVVDQATSASRRISGRTG
jgi:glycosyltransferase involved in cell wall biosynthesis